MLKDLLKSIVSNLVDKPELVKITEIKMEDKNIFEIKVGSQNLPKVIGKEGRTFKALRSLVKVIDSKSNNDIVLDTSE